MERKQTQNMEKSQKRYALSLFCTPLSLTHRIMPDSFHTSSFRFISEEKSLCSMSPSLSVSPFKMLCFPYSLLSLFWPYHSVFVLSFFSFHFSFSQIYILMELMGGGSLRHLLHQLRQANEIGGAKASSGSAQEGGLIMPVAMVQQ